MDVIKFNEKINRVDGQTYVIEEVVVPINGVYESELIHDNVDLKTLNVYTGSKLTGDKINTYATSTPSLTPWKNVIKIFSTVSTLYISYEFSGDEVEAEDINKLQDAIVDTEKALNEENDRAKAAEKVLTDNLNTEVTRAKASEKTLSDNLASEAVRAKGAENTLTINLDNETTRAKAAESTLTNNLNTTNNNLSNEITRAKNAESTLTINLSNEFNRASGAESTITNNLNSETTRAKATENTIINTINTNKPNWDDKYSKNEVDNKINQVVSNMDWKESVATFNDLSTTYATPDDGWTVNVKDSDITYRYSGSAWIPISANSIPLATSSIDGKMSKQDKIDHDDMNSKKHTHNNKTIIDTITQTLLDTWNGAYTHISDTIKHITSTERSNWTTAYTNNHTHTNKSVLDVITQVLIDNFNSAYTHVSDVVKHITSTERTLWNTISNKLDKAGGTMTAPITFTDISKYIFNLEGYLTWGLYWNTTNNSLEMHNSGIAKIIMDLDTGDITTGGNITALGFIGTSSSASKLATARKINGVPFDGSSDITITANPNAHTHDDRYYTETESDTKFATKGEISQAGYGDMLKSIYDTNNDGIVDNADRLDGFHASTVAGSANTAVIRDANGYINNTWFNSNRGSENTSASQYIYDTGDGYMRKKDLANVRAEMVTSPFGLGGMAIDISSQDCNNIVNTGFYRGNNCTNRCAGSHTWTYLLVIGHSDVNWVSQIGINFNGDGTYSRTKTNGVWSAWRRLDATATSQITNDSGFITTSSSITGNAATATKLQTTRIIAIAGDIIGSANFDGGGNISINTTLKTGLTWNDLEGV